MRIPSDKCLGFMQASMLSSSLRPSSSGAYLGVAEHSCHALHTSQCSAQRTVLSLAKSSGQKVNAREKQGCTCSLVLNVICYGDAFARSAFSHTWWSA